jgi:exo-beta-1,3-glucanase (GH17 family)
MSKAGRNILPDFADAICYSGYREGQSPDQKKYPSYDEVKEDLLIIQQYWQYIRIYDCSRHAEIVLDVIHKENLNIKVLLGAYIAAEKNNFGCPWGGVYDREILLENKKENVRELERLISFANKYPQIIFALSVGNEATVDWTDHYVSPEKILEYVKLIKKHAEQPVTFCENYVPWLSKLEQLAEELDFISIHTYPVWEYKNIHEAIDYTVQNYESVAKKYPHKKVVITEAGWATNSNGQGIDPGNVNEELQAQYCTDLEKWSRENQIFTFIFEAFDEPWKGSPDAMEPEKHWGVYTVSRKPKLWISNWENKKNKR